MLTDSKSPHIPPISLLSDIPVSWHVVSVTVAIKLWFGHILGRQPEEEPHQMPYQGTVCIEVRDITHLHPRGARSTSKMGDEAHRPACYCQHLFISTNVRP
jgi:hypothetical protein